MQTDYWHTATTELAKRDAEMATLIATYPDSVLKTRGQPFETLIRAIVGQQISVKAADAIWSRVFALGDMQPDSFAKHHEQTLRECGLSRRKVEYAQAVCEYFLTHQPNQAYFAEKTDDELIKELTAIRGIGRWTAEMFLIFTLARPNIFPTDDIGLLRGLEKHYPDEIANSITGDKLTPKQAQTLFFERFSPWATVATWYLWRSLDPVEVNY